MKNLNQENGFTLFEVILAFFILAFVMGITYSSLASILNVKTVLEERREIRQEANAILVRIARELQIASKAGSILPPCSNTQNQPPLDQNMLGETLSGGRGGRRDTIRYLAYEAGQFIPGGDRNTGLVQISYLTVQTPQEYARGRQGTWSLVREEIPRIRPFDEACKKAIRFPLSYNLTQLQIDYYDFETKTWSAEWGNRPNNRGLPDIVRVTIGFLTSAGNEETYTTSVALAKG